MKALKKINILPVLQITFWTIAIFCYFFQFPFRNLAKFIVPSIFLFAISEYKNLRLGRDKFYLFFLCVWYIFLGFECFYSIFRGNDVNNIIRFLEILSFLPVCLFIIDKKFKKEYAVLVFFAVLKCLVLLGIAIYLIKVGSHAIIRNYVMSIQGGDIYLAGRFRPKVQTQGNGLIPFVFILYNSKKLKYNIVSFILLLGTLAAGNFAFILCIGLFAFYNLYKIICSRKNRYGFITPLILFFCLLASPIVFKYIDKTRLEKSSVSNAIRIEQAQFLTDTNYLVGKGLGNNVVGQGKFRTYGGSNYFELQTLYIFNQIGIVGLAIFYTLILFKVRNKNKTSFIIFLIYLFYTFWNPYCFDTTEMMAIIALMNLPENGSVIRKKIKIKFLRYKFLPLENKEIAP